MLTATLVDAQAKAAKKAAIIKVNVAGLTIVGAADVNERPAPGQGHLHYQLDGGAIIATTQTKLSFHGLSSGQHRVVVSLAANDHSPLGPQQTLTISIP